MSNPPIPFAAIIEARKRIAGQVINTALVPSKALSSRVGGDVFLKLEHHQITGSFKLRGATNAILSLSNEEKSRGVVCVSTGNHGRGLAYAAQKSGVRCVICMSSLVPKNKVDGIKALGADVRTIGQSQDEAQVEVDRLVFEEGMIMIPPFDNPAIIAGQGTLGVEIIEQCPNAATIVVPLSGGGLISGLALAAKTTKPDLKIIGVSMKRGAAMYESQRAGHPVEVKELETLADSLGGGIGLDNAYTFAMVQDLVDDIVVLNETEIGTAIKHAYWSEGEVIEGSGAVTIGALLAGHIKGPGPIVLLLSGKNIDMQLHHDIISDNTNTRA